MRRVLVVGAGMGGLAASIDLARQGLDVTLVERAATPGGKMRELAVGARMIDAGPTVLTMRFVFDSLFADAGRRLEDFVTLAPAALLARHAWCAGGRLDLFADIDRSAEAIGAFAGVADARNYRAFAARSAAIFDALWQPFMAAPRPGPVTLMRTLGARGAASLLRAAPFRTLWSDLGRSFADPRLRQLFGRYATYVGSSPFLAPSTLMLIAAAEQRGVWLVQGGMRRLADGLHRLAADRGVRFRFGTEITRITARDGRVSGAITADGEALAADAMVFNGDASGLGPLAPGDWPEVPAPRRSLSAVTWCLQARATGFALGRHNVFFAADYAAEFRAIFEARRVPDAPTVYVCAQDRGEDAAADGAERFLVLINAPADGDRRQFDAALLWDRTARVLTACGLDLALEGSPLATTPDGFARLFPGSGGALYGRANHGAWASFARPGSATSLRGLYLAGGSAHPGAGVPMAALSGRLAAARLIADCAE